MANGSIIPSRLGQSNLTGDVNALFLKVFSNEVLTTFEEANVMKELHTVRTISSGKSAQFPTMGKATAKYHTPGADIFEAGSTYASQIKHKERVINIDDVLVAATSIANIDELKNHYDVRSAYSTELGRALAKRFDEATMKTLVAASQVNHADRANPDASQGIVIDLGSTGMPANVDTAVNLIALFRIIAQKLDEQDIPSEDRFAILAPEQYYLLAGSDSNAINRDFGGEGSIASGSILKLSGISIKTSNNLLAAGGIVSNDVAGNDVNANNNPFDDADGGSAGKGYLDAGLNTLKLVAGHKSAIGTVKLMDLAVESEYSMAKQSTLMLAKYAMGHGILRPEAAVSVIA
jgi:hypothetical protein